MIASLLEEGLPTHSEESITFKRSKLCAEMPVENKEELLDYLLSCLNDAAASGEKQIAEVYYKNKRDKFVFSDEVSDRNLWELLKKVRHSVSFLTMHRRVAYKTNVLQVTVSSVG